MPTCRFAGFAPGWAVCLEIGGEHAGVVSGAMNMFGNLGGAVSPLVAGEWLQRRRAWDLPLLTVAGSYLLAAVVGLESIRQDGLRAPNKTRSRRL